MKKSDHKPPPGYDLPPLSSGDDAKYARLVCALKAIRVCASKGQARRIAIQALDKER